MNKFVVLVFVAAVLAEGYSAASIDIPEEDAVKRIVKREATSPFSNFFSGFPFGNPGQFADANGGKSGNGQFYSSSYVSSTGVDKNGNPVSSGMEVIDNNGQKTVRRF